MSCDLAKTLLHFAAACMQTVVEASLRSPLPFRRLFLIGRKFTLSILYPSQREQGECVCVTFDASYHSACSTTAGDKKRIARPQRHSKGGACWVWYILDEGEQESLKKDPDYEPPAKASLVQYPLQFEKRKSMRSASATDWDIYTAGYSSGGERAFVSQDVILSLSPHSVVPNRCRFTNEWLALHNHFTLLTHSSLFVRT